MNVWIFFAMKSGPLTTISPEPFQDSERGEKMQSAISTLESVRDQVSEAADEIGEIWE